MLEITYTQDDNNNKIAIHGLTVMISGDDSEGWFAQGVEINYFSCGWSIDEVVDNFATGLGLTIAEHLKRYNSIEKLLHWSTTGAEEIITQRDSFRSIGYVDLPPDTGQNFPYDRLSIISKESRQVA